MVVENLFVVGLQWGDEGKGKIVDSLSSGFDFVMRFQGGNNAGHTLVVDNKKYKFSVLPSGALNGGVKLIIAGGVLLDLRVLVQEIDSLQHILQKKITNLYVSDHCHLILPLHTDLDCIYEDWRGDGSIGTTRRGVGPCCEDRVARRGLRLMDLSNREQLRMRLEIMLTYHNKLRSIAGYSQLVLKELENQLLSLYQKIEGFIVSQKYVSNVCQGEGVIFEGAQGVMLDIDYGTYPFVTSSSSMLSADMINKVYTLGVAKAYCTRVGNGPFPTEQDNPLGAVLSDKGQEFGSVTGRRRRCGWLDLVALKYAVGIVGVNALVLSKLDVLIGMEKIAVCSKYVNSINGTVTSDFSLYLRDSVWKADYQYLPGWDWLYDKDRGLHSGVSRYLESIEQVLGIPIVMISTGPGRDEYIMLKDWR